MYVYIKQETTANGFCYRCLSLKSSTFSYLRFCVILTMSVRCVAIRYLYVHVCLSTYMYVSPYLLLSICISVDAEGAY